MRPDRSLDAGYFGGIFAADEGPWNLATSGYETVMVHDRYRLDLWRQR